MAALALVGDEEAGELFLFRQLLHSALKFGAFHVSSVGQNCPSVKAEERLKDSTATNRLRSDLDLP